jgi:hypothetical protein
MSVAVILFRWLTARLRLAIGADAGHRTAQSKNGNRARAAARPLQWRAPWQTSQLLSWSAATLLAPTCWGIGALLMIDARSDHPFFWPATMAIVAIVNLVAIVCCNQRQHRGPFANRAALILYYFKVSALTGAVLFLLLGWSTGALQDFAGPMAATPAAAGHAAATALWSVAIAAGFSVLSFTHAGILHAWLAFEVPPPLREPRRKVS